MPIFSDDLNRNPPWELYLYFPEPIGIIETILMKCPFIADDVLRKADVWKLRGNRLRVAEKKN